MQRFGTSASATAAPPAAVPMALPSPSWKAIVGGHVPALDGVRGLAVLGVLLFHFVAPLEPTTTLNWVITKAAPTGAFGVELFFVLSGFLITGILIDSRTKPHYFRNFYMRRVLRIFPLYYAVLAALFFLAPLLSPLRGPTLDFLRQHQAWAWLYGVNLYIAAHGDWAFGYLNHFWSLCVEEQFYLFWPFVVWALARSTRRLMWVSLLLSAGAMLARFLGNAAGLSWWTTYVLLPFRLDGLALGGFLAALIRQPGGVETIRRLTPTAAAATTLLILATHAWAHVTRWGLTFVYTFRVSLFLVFLGCVLSWAIVAPEDSRTSRFFRSREMTFLGTYSYGLYVYHHFLSLYFIGRGTDRVLAEWLGCSSLVAVTLQAVAGIAASVVIAYGSYNLFEKRVLSLKRFFEPVR